MQRVDYKLKKEGGCMVVAKRMQRAVKNWARAAIKQNPKAMQQPFKFLLSKLGLGFWPSPNKTSK